MKRQRPCYEEGSPSDIECDWEIGKLSVVPPLDLRQPQLSPLDSATTLQLRQHLQDLRREKMTVPMLGLVTRLMIHRANQSFFNAPVDVVRLACPSYYTVIKTPMDLGTIKQQLGALMYERAIDVERDVQLVFDNARLFNPPGHVVHEAAKVLSKEFEREYAIFNKKQSDRQLKKEAHSCPHCQSHVCGLCLEKCINFEPPLVMCAGKCGQRLRRHAAYFTTIDRRLNWCVKCVPKQIESSVSGQIVRKAELVKAKFQDELTEPWVQCDSCMGWVHQICALFNGDMENDDSHYTCPLCRLDILDREVSTPTSPSTPHAHDSSDLTAQGKRKHEDMSTHSPIVKKQRKPNYMKDDHGISHLGSFMQNWIHDHLMGLGEVEAAASIIVKLASSIRVTTPINENVMKHFGNSSYPSHVTYTSKTILVFQRINGIEVCLFSMYVQEYDENCGLPANVNRTYIAYLDSLGYFRPRQARSSTYQQLVISYLAFCKARGFTHAHIWACPTTRGGDFIYWCHPTYQRNPNKDRLLMWYHSIIAKAVNQQVAYGHQTLHSSHFSTPNPFPPYFEGDYWVAEADRIANIRPRKPRKKKSSEPVDILPTVHPEKKSHAVVQAEVEASVASSKESLFVIPLQPTCSECSSIQVNVAYWKSLGSICCDSCHLKMSLDATSELTSYQRAPVPGFIKRLDDGDDTNEISCPFLNHRSDLLKYCEENHYQFDTFRRAKYSTMMLLHHLRIERDP